MTRGPTGSCCGPGSRSTLSPRTAWAACRTRPYAVQWQVATDERFHHVVRAGVAVARPEHAHAVHVTIEGLQPGREYCYRFRVEGYMSRVGRTLTAPARGTTPRRAGDVVRLVFAVRARLVHGVPAAGRGPPGPGAAPGRLPVRVHEEHVRRAGRERRATTTARRPPPGVVPAAACAVQGDLDLQAAHAVAPWLVVWDDHEVDNNWADETPEKPEEGFLERRAAAFQAYYENMPLRASSKPRGIDMQLFRRVKWGELATFHMLDTRQYRDDQGCGDGYKDCPAAVDPKRSITGARQEKWLIDGFRRSDGALGHPRPAGLLRAARQQRRPAEGHLDGLPGTGTSPPATGSPAAGSTRGSATPSS